MERFLVCLLFLACAGHASAYTAFDCNFDDNFSGGLDDESEVRRVGSFSVVFKFDLSIPKALEDSSLPGTFDDLLDERSCELTDKELLCRAEGFSFSINRDTLDVWSDIRSSYFFESLSGSCEIIDGSF